MMMKNLEEGSKIQGVPDSLENISIRMKPVLDKCWVECTGLSHTHSKEAGQEIQERKESRGIRGAVT